jgi:hypothetical protein
LRRCHCCLMPDQAGKPQSEPDGSPLARPTPMAFGDGVTHREDATIQHVGAGLDASDLDIRVTLELRSQ